MIRFGAVDCTVETSLAEKFGIKGYVHVDVLHFG